MPRPRAQRHWYRGHHPLVWVATGLNVAFMLSFMLLVSPYHGPDEGAHFDMIHQFQTDMTPRRPTKRVLFKTLAGPIDREGRVLSPWVYGVLSPRLTVDQAAPRRDRPTLAELGEPKLPAYNQMSQHPPFFYMVGAVITRAVTRPDSAWSWDRELMFDRFLCLLFVAPLALLASCAVLAIGLPRGVGAIAAAFTVLIPQKSFIGSVVNNDSLVMLLAAISVVAALRYLATRRAHDAWAAGAASGALALTKSTGAVICAWVAAIVVCTAYTSWRRGERSEAKKALIGAGALIAVGSSWYVVNVIRFGKPQPAPRRIILHPARTAFSTFVSEFMDYMSRTFWGRPGNRLGIALPWWITHPLSILTIVLVIVGALSVRSHRKYLLWLFGLVVAHSALLFRQNWKANRFHPAGPGKAILAGLQGRYFFPLLIPIAVLVATAFWRVLSRSSRAALVYAATGLLVAGAALHVALGQSMLVGYWQGVGVSYAEHLRALEAWSPLPRLVTLFVLALPFVVMAIAFGFGVNWVRKRPAPAVEAG